MSNYLKLVHFELNRFIKIYVILAVITIVSQIVGIIVQSKGYLNMANEMIYENGMSQAAFIEEYGPFSFFDILNSLWFLGPIALSAAGLIFYIFLIWYRDWFGKNTFIYRLLMLPTTRLNVFFAKASAIMLMVIGLVSLQLMLLPIENKILKVMVPKVFRSDYGVNEIIESFEYLQVIIPQSITQFVLHYGAGFMFLTIIFTAILFERSYRLKGLIMGAIYGVLAIIVFFSPIIVNDVMQNNFFYPLELLILEIVMGIIVIAGSIWLSGYLLKNKVTV